MKNCHDCGQANDDAAKMCCECGSSALVAGAVSASDPRQLEPDEIPLAAIAQSDGRTMTLRCRTPEEAYLVCDELGKSDILAIVADEEELQSQFRRNGYVEVRVSAKAYESLADLRPVVEFQYKQVRGERPLPTFGKILAITSALVIVPGLFVFVWLFGSYRKNGYDRMAKEFKLWFFLGIAAWLVVVVGMSAFA